MESPDEEKFGENGFMVFSDCGVVPNPTDEELAEIAIVSSETAKAICGMEPKVAMLSYSTMGSAKSELTQKVIDATNIVKEKREVLLLP